MGIWEMENPLGGWPAESPDYMCTQLPTSLGGTTTPFGSGNSSLGYRKRQEQVIWAMVDFLDRMCYVERRGIAAGRDLVHGFSCVLPDYYRALQAWSRLRVIGEGSPVSLEMVAVIEKEWREVGEYEAADALICCADMWLRWQDLGHLLCEDILTTAEGDVSVLLGVRKRGEETRQGLGRASLPTSLESKRSCGEESGTVVRRMESSKFQTGGSLRCGTPL